MSSSYNILKKLLSPLTILPGIGESNSLYFKNKLKINRIIDLIFYSPKNIIDRRKIYNINEIINENILNNNEVNDDNMMNMKLKSTVTMKLKINDIIKGWGNSPIRIKAEDMNNIPIEIIFFNYSNNSNNIHNNIYQNFPINSIRLVSGPISIKPIEYRDKKNNNIISNLQMIQPTAISSLEDADKILNIEPIYSLPKEIKLNLFKKSLKTSLKYVQDLNDWLPSNILKDNNWPNIKDVFHNLHLPKNKNDLLSSSNIKTRLGFDELLSYQIKMHGQRLYYENNRNGELLLLNNNNNIMNDIINLLPFQLTKSQYNCFNEILNDMKSKKSMYRLLQGDVGSGKTIIAYLSMIYTMLCNSQSIFIAPTEILAQQHYNNLNYLLSNLNLLNNNNDNITLFTSNIKGNIRNDIINNIENNNIKFIIGTSALLTDKINYNNLGLLILDEEHRFGAKQRAYNTQAKNILWMSATPIPRTLSLTTYSDLEFSNIIEKPNKKINNIINTSLYNINDKNINYICNQIKNELDNTINGKIFWVLPTLEKTSLLNITSCIDRYEMLKLDQRFNSNEIGILHGKLTFDEKNQIINDFENNKKRILVTTSIIEVGIDIKGASICIIENAERFGLSQLHQMRGRIGRHDIISNNNNNNNNNNYICNCYLLYNDTKSLKTEERMKIMEKCNDGFEIAEYDLHLRGGGDIYGNRQSGKEKFNFIDINTHENLFHSSKTLVNEWFQILTNNNNNNNNNDINKIKLIESIQNLLYIFSNNIEINDNDNKELLNISNYESIHWLINYLYNLNNINKNEQNLYNFHNNIKKKNNNKLKTKSTSINERKRCIINNANINDYNIILFDLETTGYGKYDKIIQIALMPLLKDKLNHNIFYSQIINPNKKNINNNIIELTGLTQEVINESPVFSDGWINVIRWISNNFNNKPIILCAHQVHFDHRMLLQEFKRLKYKDEDQPLKDLGVYGFLDTLTLFKDNLFWNNKEKPSDFKLTTLNNVILNNNDDINNTYHHDALYDIFILNQLFHSKQFENWPEVAQKYSYQIEMKKDNI